MRPQPSSPRITAAIGVLLGTAAGCVLLTGCIGNPGGDAPEVDPARIVDGYDCLAPNLIDWALPRELRSTAVPEHPYAPRAGRVPEGFTPTTAVRCDVLADLGDGQGFSVTAVTFAGDLAPLLAALAEPDDDDSNVACMENLELVPPLWLVDEAGRAIHAHYPRDACTQTKPGVRDALAELTVQETTTVKRIP
ncbi:hypothetical protein K2F54_14165 [Cryobacterium sp. 1639]|uniref:hypothetical protein n=1 Tax=Cryobacterium inferilacus TaxID=2866629 RepID=UPI001C72B7B9|nr:hypothetical protein [Cryobacterium sp. 1639]MBX0301116.1 hypothetical protein [Cryobacterium sp. 1639]